MKKVFEKLDFENRIKNEISNSINQNIFPQAVILEGSNAVLRLAAAKEIAAALVCTGEKKPCGLCKSCKKVESGIHPDVYILQKDEGASAIKVDDVRTVREKAKLLPNDGDRSVFVICEAQNMNPQAQNALLKIFEEPAPHVYFVLTCPSRAALLETIVSRAASYMLSQEESSLEGEEAQKALSAAVSVAEALCVGEFELLKATSVFLKDKALFKGVLPFLICIFRDALVSSKPLSGAEETAKKLRLVFTPKKLLSLIEETEKLLDFVERSANHNLSITRLCSVYSGIKNS